MKITESFTIHPIGYIRSEITNTDDAPKQGDEGAPDAWIELTPEAAPGALRIRVGTELIVLTWLHLGDREVLQVHPRSDPNRPLTGVFGTRSPDRPNPIGLHHVTVREVDGNRLRISDMEAIDGTPVIDIKPMLAPIGER